MSIFIGIVLSALGIAMVIKTEPIYHFTGASAWAEKNLGTEGGTRLLIKIIGLLLIFFGFATITGLVDSILFGLIRLIVPGA